VRFDEEGHVIRDRISGEGAIAYDVRAPRAGVGGASARLLWVCVGVLAAGGGLIGLLVTVLKYCHELIETANALRVLGG
jgi:hypothetical protein